MTTSATLIIKKLLILFLISAGLYYAKDFLIPLTIGGVLATLFLPVCKGMEARKVPKGLAVLNCLLLFLLAIAVVGALLGWQIAELTKDFSLLKQKSIETFNHLQEYLFNHLGISTEKQSQILNNEQPGVTVIMKMVAGSLISVLTNFILVLAYIFLFLYYRVHLLNFFLQLSPAGQRTEMRQLLYSISHVSQQYLLGLAKMIVCLWIMYSIGFTIMGVKNAFFFAILCGLLEIVPFVGNITGTTLTVLVAAVQGAGIPMLVGIVCTYGIIQFIQGWVLEPLILGPQVKINPFATIIALVLGELLWGIPGIFLAIPLTAMFKIVCDHIELLQPYGFLIGKIETGKAEPGFIKKIMNRYKTRK